MNHMKHKVFYGYYIVLIAFIVIFISIGTSVYIFSPFFMPMASDFSWSRTDFAIAKTIGDIVMALITLFIGRYLDQKGAKRLVLLGSIIMGGALYLCSTVTYLWQWWLYYGVFLNVGAAFTGLLVFNVTLSKWFVIKRGLAISIAAMGVSLAGMIITPLVSLFIDAFHWINTWKILSLFVFFVMAPLSFFIHRRPEDLGLNPDGISLIEHKKNAELLAQIHRDESHSFTRTEAVKTHAFYLLILSFGFSVLSLGFIFVHTLPLFSDFDYSRPFAAFMITLASIPALLTKPFWGVVLDKVDARMPSMFSFVFIALAMLLIPYSISIHDSFLIYIGFFILGTGWGGLIPIEEAFWARFFGRKHLGEIRSISFPISFIFMGLGSLLGALVFDYLGSYTYSFYLISFLNVVSALLVLLIKKPTKYNIKTKDPSVF